METSIIVISVGRCHRHETQAGNDRNEDIERRERFHADQPIEYASSFNQKPRTIHTAEPRIIIRGSAVAVLVYDMMAFTPNDQASRIANTAP